MREKKQAKDTMLVPIVCCFLPLIALAALLWSLRLLMPVLLVQVLAVLLMLAVDPSLC